MLILGIDPALSKTGLALINIIDNQPIHLSHKLITSKNTLTLDQRLKYIYDHTQEYLHIFTPDLIIIEDLFVGINRNTIIKLSMARSIFLLISAQKNSKILHLPTKIIKQHVTGNGGADKQDVMIFVQQKLNLAHVDQQDCIDALACALCWTLAK